MTSKTSLQKWSGVFLFPSDSPVFFQIGTVTYQHRLRFRWRGFMYEFLPLIRKARTRCDLTGFHLAARSAQVLSLGRLACWRSSRPGARGLSARFNTLSLPRAPRLFPVAVDITMLTRRKLRLEGVDSERLTPNNQPAHLRKKALKCSWTTLLNSLESLTPTSRLPDSAQNPSTVRNATSSRHV